MQNELFLAEIECTVDGKEIRLHRLVKAPSQHEAWDSVEHWMIHHSEILCTRLSSITIHPTIDFDSMS